MGSKDDRFAHLAKATEALDASLLEHVIFLPKPLADHLKTLRQQHVSLGNRFLITVHRCDDSLSIERWIEIAEKVESEVQESMEKLEAAMRATFDGLDIVVTRTELDTSVHRA